MTNNEDILTPIKGIVSTVVIGISGYVANVPWIGCATFFGLLLNAAYIIYKWRMSHLFNQESMKQSKLKTLILEKELQNLESRA